MNTAIIDERTWLIHVNSELSGHGRIGNSTQVRLVTLMLVMDVEEKMC